MTAILLDGAFDVGGQAFYLRQVFDDFADGQRLRTRLIDIKAQRDDAEIGFDAFLQAFNLIFALRKFDFGLSVLIFEFVGVTLDDGRFFLPPHQIIPIARQPFLQRFDPHF